MSLGNDTVSLKLILQSRPQQVRNETEIVGRMFDAGLEQLNLYKPDFSAAEMRSFIEKINPVYHQRIVLYSHYSLIKHYNLGGVHISQTDLTGFLSKLYLRYILGRKTVQISTTVNSIRAIADCSKLVSEILLGPVFVNTGNNIFNLAYSKKVLEKGVKEHHNRIIALGGICEKNIPYLKSLNLKGALLHRSVWDDPDPVSAFAKIRNCTQAVAA